jgi:hypothetical protein
MADSTLWDAQDALHALVAATVTAPAKVDYGHPSEFHPDHVWVEGAVDEWSGEFAVSGLGAEDERFNLHVTVQCMRAGEGYQAVRDRCKGYAEAIRAAIKADPTLGGVVQLAQVARWRVDESMVTESTRAVKVMLTVACQGWAT